MNSLKKIILEKLIITKDTKEKSLNNIKKIHWANLYNIFCYLYLDTKFIYKFRDTINNAGDVYYVSFIVNRKNIGNKSIWDNRTFFKDIHSYSELINFDDEETLHDKISKNINKNVLQSYAFSVKEYFNSLLFGISLDTDNENIVYLVSADKDDLNEITKTFMEIDNWEIYDKDIYKALYK